MKRPNLSAMAGLLFIANGLAQSQPIPVDPAVRIGKLDNGLTYYIRHNAEPQGQANFYIAQKVGSIFCKEYVDHFISNEPIPSIENDYAMTQQIASAINADMVSKILAQMVGNNNLVLAAMLPDKEGVVYPSQEEVTNALAAVAAEEIAPYEDAVSDEPLLSSLPTAGRITKSNPAQMGYKQYTLSNGATVYFRQTDFNANEVLMTAVSHGGTSLYPTSMSADIKALNEVMTVGGVGKFSMTELRKVLAGRKVSITPNVGLFAEYINAKATPKDLETMLQLNYLYFTGSAL